MRECLSQNKFLEEISLDYNSIILDEFVKILMYNYNSKLSFYLFESHPKLDEIIIRNEKLHHYIFYNFHFYDFIFVFDKENKGKRKVL
jgi:hypothetical protein